MRCSICDAVNNSQVENHLGDYVGLTPGDYFSPDPKDKNQFICKKCKTEIDDVKRDYFLDDEAQGRFEREFNY